MQKYLRAFWIVLQLFILTSLIFAASESDGSLTWVSQTNNSITASFSADRCMDATGTQELNVKVFKFPTGSADDNATVTAVVEEADGDTNNITFTNEGDGNYTFDFTFDANGTYFFKVNASDTNRVTGIVGSTIVQE